MTPQRTGRVPDPGTNIGGLLSLATLWEGVCGNDTFSAAGSKRPCSRPASGPSNAFKLENVLISSHSVHDIHMNQGNLNALRSMRLRNESESKYVACAPSALIALLLP